MSRKSDLVGEKFGHLIVLQKMEEKENGYFCWRCQCDCGRKIIVNTKKLKRGTTTNCGCSQKNNAKNGVIAENIEGKRFGRLVAVRRVENKNGRTAWECLCDCGNLHVATTKDLKDGNCKSCGCLKHEKNVRIKNIRGIKFGRLTAEYPLERRNNSGSVYWHCKCECGNTADVNESELVFGNSCSCGCYRRENVWNKIPERLHFIDGTCVEFLKSRKSRSDNKSGFRGVFLQSNGRYRVGIGFKGRRYHIATVDTLNEAIQARLDTERIVHDGFLEEYNQWAETEGNEQTPFLYSVEKVNGEFVVSTY
jgi:hypothetical protein